MEHTIRINKALANAGICSRRRADELIAAGQVRVNGEPVVTAGMQVCPDTDVIEVQGRRIQCAESPCYLLLHKPIRVVSTASDPEGRTTVLDLLPEPWRGKRLYPAGRLDFFSEGLVLLTNDGALTQRLMHPKHQLPRVYRVLVRGAVPASALETMRSGMTLAEGEQLAPVAVRVLTGTTHDLSGRHQADPRSAGNAAVQGKRAASRSAAASAEDAASRSIPNRMGRMDNTDRTGRTDRTDRTGRENGQHEQSPQLNPSGQSGTLLELTLHQGLNRQIRRMCRDLGLTILRLIRVSHGTLQLGSLPAGQVRELTSTEVATLKRAAGLPVASESDAAASQATPARSGSRNAPREPVQRDRGARPNERTGARSQPSERSERHGDRGRHDTPRTHDQQERQGTSRSRSEGYRDRNPAAKHTTTRVGDTSREEGKRPSRRSDRSRGR